MHREYELAASRTFGYDAYDLRCFYHHSYVLTETRSDNDEDFTPSSPGRDPARLAPAGRSLAHLAAHRAAATAA